MLESICFCAISLGFKKCSIVCWLYKPSSIRFDWEALNCFAFFLNPHNIVASRLSLYSLPLHSLLILSIFDCLLSIFITNTMSYSHSYSPFHSPAFSYSSDLVKNCIQTYTMSNDLWTPIIFLSIPFNIIFFLITIHLQNCRHYVNKSTISMEHIFPDVHKTAAIIHIYTYTCICAYIHGALSMPNTDIDKYSYSPTNMDTYTYILEIQKFCCHWQLHFTLSI